VVLAVGCGSIGSTRGPAGAGDPAPALTGTTLDGATFDLAALRGRPVIVNFWASWCVPCREEFPLFVDAARVRAGDGLEIVGVEWRNDDDSAAREFAASHGATWPTVTDPDGSRATAWQAVAPPQTYFIGRDGVIRSRQIGALTQAEFDRQLAAILQ
jgi:cytochrome c biogenesis protein CcmG/thiol:disulfide interchange protein DsbE